MIKNAILSATARALIATAVIGGGLVTANAALAQASTPSAKATALANLKTALASATTKAQVVAALNAAAAAGLTKADVVSTMKSVQAEAETANNTVLAAVITSIVTAVEANNVADATVVTFTTTATADIGQPNSGPTTSSTGGDTTVSVYVG